MMVGERGGLGVGRNLDAASAAGDDTPHSTDTAFPALLFTPNCNVRYVLALITYLECFEQEKVKRIESPFSNGSSRPGYKP